ncbi:MAG: hypothetical protein ACRD0F_08605, partial [Acidimicrobiales bacterium]
MVGHNDLGGQGLNGDVAVIGSTAIVAAGYVPMNTMQAANTKTAALNNAPPCVTVPIKIVDISDPANPRVTATIEVPPGAAARDVDALHVSTPTFSGHLAAVAFASCDYDQATFRSVGVVRTGSFYDRGVAYYDVSDPVNPRLLGRYFADFENVDPGAPPCAPPPNGTGVRCAQDQFSVQLKRLPDGRILSLSTRPDGAERNTLASDIRIVDVTDPHNPNQIGSWPPLGEAPSRNSNNGCYPRSGVREAQFTEDGSKIVVAHLDGGLIVLNALDLGNPVQIGQWNYPLDWEVEGNGASVSLTQVGGRHLALMADEDWWWQNSVLRIDSPASLAGEYPGCMDLFSAFDQKYVAQIHQAPGNQISGELAFVGRGCPTRIPAPPTVVPPDPYLSNPSGKIMFADNSPTNPQTGLPAAGCTFNSRVRRAQDDGAKAVVLITAAATPESIAGFPPTGSPREPRDQNSALTGDASIPGFQLKQPPGFAIRSVLCPQIVSGACTGGQPVFGTLMDKGGEWGGLRVIDVTNPGAPSQVAVHHTSRAKVMPPPDVRGVYSAHHAATEGERAYVAWNSDGIRVLDLSATGAPSEIGWFVPPDRPDPTGTVPGKAFVVGVALTASHIVISDINSGLWVLEKPAPAGARGLWAAGADGGVFTFDGAPFLGSMGGARLARAVVGMAT